MCGGLGGYFGVDPTAVRVAAVFLSVLGPATFVAYLAALLLMPEEPEFPAPSVARMPPVPAPSPVDASPANPVPCAGYGA